MKKLNLLWEKAGAVFPTEKSNGRPRKKLPPSFNAMGEQYGIAEACRRLGVARSTFYRHLKWLNQSQ
jgi:transcriptional regulator of acetoin/glycerol metabolism|tara:strand:- start:1334 stop:1534 length:201 start_codon:yes stop_codon:yes gene_type:complete